MSDYNIQDYVSRINNDLTTLSQGLGNTNAKLIDVITNKIRQANPGVEIDFSHFNFSITNPAGGSWGYRETDQANENIDNTGVSVGYKTGVQIIMNTNSDSTRYVKKSISFTLNQQVSFREIFDDVLPNASEVYHYDKIGEVRGILERVFDTNVNGGVSYSESRVNDNHKVLVIQPSNHIYTVERRMRAVALSVGYKAIHFVREPSVLEDFNLNNTLDVAKSDLVRAA